MASVYHQLPVAEQNKICSKFFLLRLKAGAFKNKILPGQFIHVRVSDGLEPFFRRPFSVHRSGKYLEILYEVVGRGTEMLSQKKRGDVLDVLGPLGNGFMLPPSGIRNVIMIAGGVGVAPFLILSDVLKRKRIKMVLLYGGRTRDYIFPMNDFKKNRVQVLAATDDGSAGQKGRVSVLFDRIATDPATTFVYTCGPRPMMALVQSFCRQRGIKGQASCEERMACGLGACLGCVVTTADGYKTACYDGPVFDLDEIVF